MATGARRGLQVHEIFTGLCNADKPGLYEHGGLNFGAKNLRTFQELTGMFSIHIAAMLC